MADVNQVAAWYTKGLKECGLTLPYVPDGFISSWAQYTVQLPETVNRASVQEELKSQDIPTMIYYIKPMHQQGAFENTDSANADCPVTEKLCATVLSLPMHPYLTKEDVSEVVGKLQNAICK